MALEDEKFGVCRLCREEKELCRSHIFPEFFYRPMYEEGYVETLALDRQAVGRLRKGLRERLLCDDCEGLLNRLGEDYASKFFSRTVGTWDFASWGCEVTGLDYTQLKTFQVSLLWRASISSLDFFSAVQLGSHEERIRQKLYRRETFDAFDYGCAMFLLRDAEGFPTGLMTAPARSRVRGIWSYVFLLAGFCWTFVVSRHALDQETRSVFVQPDGTVRMPYRALNEFPALWRTVARLKEQGKLIDDAGD